MVDAQSLGKEGTKVCRQSALGALHSLSSPTSVQEVSLEWEVGSETCELPQVQRRCSRRSHGPQIQPSPLAAEPNPA